MTVLVRIVMLLLGYILACIGASIVLTIGTLTPEWDDLASLGLSGLVVWSTIGIGAAIIASIALVPAAVVMALAEGFAWRSSILYAALGGALALALGYGVDFANSFGGPDSDVAHQREVLAAAGIAGGFVYWLVAGRKAGS